LGFLDGPGIEADCGEEREKMKLDSGVKICSLHKPKGEILVHKATS